MLASLQSLPWTRVPVVFDNYLSHINIISKWEIFNWNAQKNGEGVLRHLVDHMLVEVPEEEAADEEGDKEDKKKKKKKKHKKVKHGEEERASASSEPPASLEEKEQVQVSTE